MKRVYSKIFIIMTQLLMLLVIGCNVSSSVNESNNNTNSEEIIVADITSESESVKTVEPNGILTDSDVAKIDAIIQKQDYTHVIGYTGLFDFDFNSIPEVYIVYQDSGQECKSVSIFDMDGNEIGQFDGYCRDGYCRLSYGEDCVYVHNFYEHSEHSSYEDVLKLTMEDGRITTTCKFRKEGYANNFPLQDIEYYINEELVGAKEYYTAYNAYLCEAGQLYTREANEVSICTDAFRIDNSDANSAQLIVNAYNSYLRGKIAAKQLFGESSYVFAFDEYTGDKVYEALVCGINTEDNWYFWNGETLEKTEVASESYDDFTRVYSLLIAQDLKTHQPCTLIGMKEGVVNANVAPKGEVFLRPWMEDEYHMVDLENYLLILERPCVDENCDETIFLPYYYTCGYPLMELEPAAVTYDNFEERPDVKELFDAIEAEGGIITGAFLRGERYLNINYDIQLIDSEGIQADASCYRTYMIQNFPTLIDEGKGTYQ